MHIKPVRTIPHPKQGGSTIPIVPLCENMDSGAVWEFTDDNVMLRHVWSPFSVPYPIGKDSIVSGIRQVFSKISTKIFTRVLYGIPGQFMLYHILL